MQFALDAHRAHLLPDFHGVHCGPGVGIAVDEEHRCGVEVESELGHKRVGIIISSRHVLAPVGVALKGICRIDSDSPLHLAGEFVYVVDGIVALVAGRCDSHKGEMASGR